jgi:hypothetical protein
MMVEELRSPRRYALRASRLPSKYMASATRLTAHSARVLAKAEESFPTPIRLCPSELLEEEGIEPDKHAVFLCDHILSWLSEEGFFRSSGSVLSGTGDRMEPV